MGHVRPLGRKAYYSKESSHSSLATLRETWGELFGDAKRAHDSETVFPRDREAESRIHPIRDKASLIRVVSRPPNLIRGRSRGSREVRPHRVGYASSTERESAATHPENKKVSHV